MTFLTMAYIIVLNPIILGFVPDSTGAFLGGDVEPGSGFPRSRRPPRSSPAC